MLRVSWGMLFFCISSVFLCFAYAFPIPSLRLPAFFLWFLKVSVCFSSACQCFSFVLLMLFLCLLCRVVMLSCRAGSCPLVPGHAVSYRVVPCRAVPCRNMSYRVVPLLQPPLWQILSRPISINSGLDTLSVVVLP